MSENLKPETKRKLTTQGKVAKYMAIVLASVSAGSLLGQSYEKSLTPAKTTSAEQEVTNRIALGEAVNVLQNDTAVVTMSNGEKVTITNPLIANNGAALERTPVVDTQTTTVTAFVPGENNVSSVEYYAATTPLESAKFTTEAETLATATRVQAVAEPNAPYLSVSKTEPGFGIPGEHIAEGTTHQPVNS